MSEDIEKAFKGQAPGYSKHVGYTRYVNGKAIRVEGGAQPHQKVTLAAPGSVKHKGGEFLDRLHSYVHKKAPTTEHELQEAVHRFVHGKFEGDEKALQKFHSEGMKELSKHGLVTHHESKAKRSEEKPSTKSREGQVGKIIPKKVDTSLGRGGEEIKLTPTAREQYRADLAKYGEKKARAIMRTGERPKEETKSRKEAPHPADQELAERKKEKPAATHIPPRAPSARTQKQNSRKEEATRSAAEAQARQKTVEHPKVAESLPKIPSFEEASHKRLSKLAEHPKAKKKAIAALAERIASKPENATHADLHAELSALEQRHGIDAEERPEKIGFHEAAVQRAMKKFPSGKAILDATGQDSPPHVKANAYEAARRLNEGQKATPASTQSAAKPVPKAEEKPAASPAAAPKIGKFDEGSVRYLVEHMSESELRSRLPQASDSIKNNVNEALRRIAEKKEEKTS